MPGTVMPEASPRYLQKTNVGFVRKKVWKKSLMFFELPLDKSHFITEIEVPKTFHLN